MSPAATIILAFGMSIDAFVAALGRGAAGRPRFGEALKAGAVFGLIETLTPLAGWFAGLAASRFVESVDHWIAFVLLGLVGGRMIVHALRAPDAADTSARPASRSFVVLLATAFGTSIDAMIVGVSLAFIEVDIVVVAIAIGLATFLMSTGGMLVGHLIGTRLGRWAEIAGGFALIGLGASILYRHLSA